jgi:hypothetical protein
MIAGYGFYFHPLQVTTTENIKILKNNGFTHAWLCFKA